MLVTIKPDIEGKLTWPSVFTKKIMINILDIIIYKIGKNKQKKIIFIPKFDLDII